MINGANCKPSLLTFVMNNFGLLFQRSIKSTILHIKVKRTVKSDWGILKMDYVLNYYMLLIVFLTQILVNCLSFTAKNVDISNLQNLVCGQIWNFLMSVLVFAAMWILKTRGIMINNLNKNTVLSRVKIIVVINRNRIIKRINVVGSPS